MTQWVTPLEYVDNDTPIELTRDDVFAALEALGSPLSERANSHQLVTAFRAAVNKLPDTISEIDAKLAKPCSDQRRGRLTWRKLELERAAQEAANRKPPVVGGLIVNAPPGTGTLFLGAFNPRTVNAETVDGKTIVRLFGAEFKNLASRDPRWAALNPQLTSQLL